MININVLDENKSYHCFILAKEIEMVKKVFSKKDKLILKIPTKNKEVLIYYPNHSKGYIETSAKLIQKVYPENNYHKLYSCNKELCRLNFTPLELALNAESDSVYKFDLEQSRNVVKYIKGMINTLNFD